MKPILGFFFVTSLSGTLGFLLYMALSHIFLRSLSGACRYRMMKVCLLFYLFPFVLVKFHWDVHHCCGLTLRSIRALNCFCGGLI